MPDLSIVIINYNTSALLCQCIHSIVAHTTEVSYEIIVVDNNSVKDDLEALKTEFHSVRWIMLTENLGFGWANNIGMQAARGKYILLLNADTIVLDNALDRVVQRFQNITDDSIGLLACTLLNEDGTVQHSVFGKGRKPRSSWEMFTVALRRSEVYCFAQRLLRKPAIASASFNYGKEQIVGGFSGAFILLRREVFEKVGGFDPDFFMYCEETHWIRYVVGKHYRCLYTPVARVVHLGGKSSSRGQLQNYLSSYLYMYKTVPQFFYAYAAAELMGKTMDALALLCSGKVKKAREVLHKLWIGISATRQIPSFPTGYGSRGKHFLKVEQL